MEPNIETLMMSDVIFTSLVSWMQWLFMTFQTPTRFLKRRHPTKIGCLHFVEKHIPNISEYSHSFKPRSHKIQIHPGTLTAGTLSHGGLVQIIFLFNWVIFRWTMLIFRGVFADTTRKHPLNESLNHHLSSEYEHMQLMQIIPFCTHTWYCCSEIRPSPPGMYIT